MDYVCFEWYAINFHIYLNTKKKLFLGTMAELAARKQRYKLNMFKRLYRILLIAVIIIALFFVVSSLSFSNRLAEGTININCQQGSVNSLLDLQIMLQTLGKFVGGFSMVGLPFCISSLLSL